MTPFQREIGGVSRRFFSNIGRKHLAVRFHSREIFERPRRRSRNGQHARLRQGERHRPSRALRRRSSPRRPGHQEGACRRRRGQAHARQDAGQHRGHTAHEGRRDRRFRHHRSHAPPFHPERAQPPDPHPSPHHRIHPLGGYPGRAQGRQGDGGVGGGPRGLPHRGAHGRRHRRRPACQRACPSRSP